MAEFVKTMEEARRLCAAQENCEKCPIGNAKALECGITPTSEMDCKEVERRVMQWAAEHPEPVYPSWKDGWKQLFPDADIRHTLCPEVFGDKYSCDWRHDDIYICDKCLERPMPAEVAEKLGIKPVAPEKPVPEHDGCEGCKWCSKTEKEEPCVNCRGTLYGGVDEKPDLWEAAE